ncbi:hypothetical protein [Modicisalibacter tunisiensis]|uniref:Uncharacterized protein n=1 Tax=Modicisalibacter tunisiensis TaxID=390637 RepID=A0ABS7X2X7_9GAMM|nr:hypothetical protein [Modicisalibacter tunisiensis]MBZ9540523.1 hypothetical protein [Modicisalibacter tunisiensis]MBZ9569254.1 hypothetical protein [Modicisalibacter tunisiensis]
MTLKKPVTERALTARLNRYLKKAGQKLCKTPPSAQQELGTWHVINMEESTIAAHGIEDLEQFAREEGVLKPFEALEG